MSTKTAHRRTKEPNRAHHLPYIEAIAACKTDLLAIGCQLLCYRDESS